MGSWSWVCSISRQRWWVFWVLISLSILGGCQSGRLELKQLAKTDIDTVTDSVITTLNSELILLMEKLYARNPRELRKVAGMSLEQRHQMLFSHSGALKFSELNNLQELDALNLAFEPAFKGDRVFALMTGLVGMLRSSYGYRGELFMFDELDAQKLYYSARNIEVLLWKLAQQHPEGGYYLITARSPNGTIDNLSYERLMGKLIALQDMMAVIVEGKTDRTINRVVTNLSTVFLPI